MRKLILSTTILALILCSQAAHAWGKTGHRVSGQIAELYLSPNAKQKIAELLPNESLAEASTYADEMRSNPAPFWQKTAGPFHYVTVPDGKHYHEVGAPEKGDSVTALQMFTKTLQDDSASLADKQVALRFIIHIIGDLHQPLHAGNGTDRGGNDVKVEFFWQPSNLHRVWDSGLVDHEKLSYLEMTNFLAAKISAEQAEAWQTIDPLVYIAESVSLRDALYPTEDSLSWDYVYVHKHTMKLRLQQAGVRIAAYLNAIFAE